MKEYFAEKMVTLVEPNEDEIMEYLKNLAENYVDFIADCRNLVVDREGNLQLLEGPLLLAVIADFSAPHATKFNPNEPPVCLLAAFFRWYRHRHTRCGAVESPILPISLSVRKTVVVTTTLSIRSAHLRHPIESHCMHCG